MKSLFCALLVLVCVPLAHGQDTIFHYRVSAGDEGSLPNVPSVGGEDGTADDTTELDTDIPTVGVPAGAGNRSIDGGGIGGVNSADVRELDNFDIADAGGFTFETWFNWDGTGDINSIIDYSGTEKLVIDVNQGEELRMRTNSNGGLDVFIAEVEADEWYYTAVVFDTMGNEVDEEDANSITGTYTLYFDGEEVDETDEITISEFGDSLDRTIGVAKHPQGFARDFFNGLVYEPRVTLGALGVDDLLYVSGDGGVTGDYNNNGSLDAGDLDLQTAAIASNDLAFDENNDGTVDIEDRRIWVNEFKNTWMGDTDLNGEFDSSDFVLVFTAGKFETGDSASFSQGDWDGDGDFDSGDFVEAFGGGGFEVGPRPGGPNPVMAVPEPSSALLLLCGLVSLRAIRRKSTS